MPAVLSRSATAVYLSLDRRKANCCCCNCTGRCWCYSCVKAGRLCVECSPRRLGLCLKQTDLSTTVSHKVAATAKAPSFSPPVNSGTTPASFQQSTVPVVPVAPAQPLSPFPSLSSILEAKVLTLLHVPKGARDDWAKLLALGDVFSAVCYNPSDRDEWSKCFMVP